MNILLYYTKEYLQRSGCHKLLLENAKLNNHKVQIFHLGKNDPPPPFAQEDAPDAVLLRTSVSGTEEDFNFVSRTYKNIPVINSVKATEICADKEKVLSVLSAHKVPIPEYGTITRAQFLSGIRPQYPFVLKKNGSSQGRDVHFVQNELEALNLLKEGNIYIHEKLIEESFGVAVRVLMIGNRHTAYLRKAPQGELVANWITGTGHPYEVPPAMLKICQAAKEALGLDIVGIDVLLGKDQTYYICDANSAPSYVIPDFCNFNASLETYRYIEAML